MSDLARRDYEKNLRLTVDDALDQVEPDVVAESLAWSLPRLIDRRAAHALVERIYDLHHAEVPEIDRSQPTSRFERDELDASASASDDHDDVLPEDEHDDANGETNCAFCDFGCSICDPNLGARRLRRRIPVLATIVVAIVWCFACEHEGVTKWVGIPADHHCSRFAKDRIAICIADTVVYHDDDERTEEIVALEYTCVAEYVSDCSGAGGVVRCVRASKGSQARRLMLQHQRSRQEEKQQQQQQTIILSPPSVTF